jgi:protein SCO1/2
VLLAALFVAAPAVSAPIRDSERIDRSDPLPKRLKGVDVKEHLESEVPKNLGFTDENGRKVTLGEYFDGRLPVIITMNYSGCPMLCSVQLTSFTNSLKELDFTAGQQFRVVTVSLDSKETPEIAHKTQNRYLGQYGRPEAKDGWHFLTGSDANVHALAAALGIVYSYNEARAEYVHPATLVMVTPDGKIARYLYGLDYPEKNLRLGLVESSQGRIGSTVDKLILFCFHYDSAEGHYAPVVLNIMKLGGAASVGLLAGLVLLLSRSPSRKRPLAERTAP